MNFRDIPQSVSLSGRIAYNLIVPTAVLTAAFVITVSEFSKRRIVEQLRVDPNRLFVIHEGPLEGFEAFRESEWADFSVRNRIRARYFLSISSGAQHKNIRRLVHAFVRMKDRTDQDYQLILAGHGMDRELSAFLDDVDHRDSVVATGFVSGIQKQMLLRNATAYVFPSLYEGFGLPALEAESSGLPLAASKAGSLPEICGAGRYILMQRLWTVSQPHSPIWPQMGQCASN